MPNFSKLLSSHKIAVLIMFIFGVFFCLESLVNHYLFRTYSLDLGAYTKAMYDYSKFRSSYSTLIFESNNILSCHFSLYPILVSPFRFIFGSYTLLIFQIAAILWGGWGCYIFFKSKSNNQYIPVLALLHFFCTWAIYSALSFDYHDNVIAAMFVPWLIYFFEKKEWKTCAIYFVLILIAKENMALWMIFIAIGLFIHYRKSRWHRNVAIFMCCFALVYFIATVKIFMPFFDIKGQDQIGQLQRYTELGATWSEIIRTILTRPLYVLSLFFNNTTTDVGNGSIKPELHYMVLLCGGWALLFRPAYLVMLIPIYAQKLLTSDYSLWGINGQYSIEFVPILTLAVFSFIITIKKHWVAITFGIFTAVITGTLTVIKMNTRESRWYDRNNNYIFIKDHYSRDLDVSLAYRLMNLIPKESAVSTHSVFVPHLALRDKIYCFPDVKDAIYILLPLNQSVVTWPISRVAYDKAINDLINSSEWKVLSKQNNLLFLKRIRFK